MQIHLAHIHETSSNGQPIDYAIFDARSSSGLDRDNGTLLAQLTMKARASGLKVDASALAYSENGQLKFYGAPIIVNAWVKRGLPRWTHDIQV